MISVPNLAIFRTGDNSFVEISISEKFDAVNRIEFEIADDDDSYFEMKYNSIVLGLEIERGSKDLGWYEILDRDESPAIIREIPETELNSIVKNLAMEFMISQRKKFN